MTVASEISRLQCAKADIRQAIIDKGVSVGANLTLDDYAACISAIKIPKFIEFLLIGGGSAGRGWLPGSWDVGDGGDAGCVIHRVDYPMSGCCCVKIGAGGDYNCNGGDSEFGILVAQGGQAGGSSARGGDGAGGEHCGKNGGIGIISDISGNTQCYGGGGGSGDCGSGQYGGGNGGGTSFNGGDATTYGSGGGGGGMYNTGPGRGCQGVFIARYPTACNYNITGGCKYTCGDYTIHCFTSDGCLIAN